MIGSVPNPDGSMKRPDASPTWDILIATIVHRTDMLTELLEHLERQLVPGVGVLVYRDNREQLYGPKCQRLYDASQADYVSMLDDDDWVSDDYIPAVMEALKERPDYVGYKILYTEFGVAADPDHPLPQVRRLVRHPGALYRDICHKNPLRRDLAIQAPWEGDGGADITWAFALRQLGIVKTEVFIDRELYHYRSTGAYNSSGLAPMDDPPPRPDFDFVTMGHFRDRPDRDDVHGHSLHRAAGRVVLRRRSRASERRYWQVETGDVVLDIGAGYGSYTLPALACGARVYAIDSNR